MTAPSHAARPSPWTPRAWYIGVIVVGVLILLALVVDRRQCYPPGGSLTNFLTTPTTISAPTTISTPPTPQTEWPSAPAMVTPLPGKADDPFIDWCRRTYRDSKTERIQCYMDKGLIETPVGWPEWTRQTQSAQASYTSATSSVSAANSSNRASYDASVKAAQEQCASTKGFASVALWLAAVLAALVTVFLWYRRFRAKRTDRGRTPVPDPERTEEIVRPRAAPEGFSTAHYDPERTEEIVRPQPARPPRSIPKLPRGVGDGLVSRAKNVRLPKAPKLSSRGGEGSVSRAKDVRLPSEFASRAKNMRLPSGLVSRLKDVKLPTGLASRLKNVRLPKNRKLLIGVGGGTAALVVLIVIVTAFSGGNDALSKRDLEAQIRSVAAFTWGSGTTVKCNGGLPNEVGATQTCTAVSADGDRRETVRVKVIEVNTSGVPNWCTLNSRTNECSY